MRDSGYRAVLVTAFGVSMLMALFRYRKDEKTKVERNEEGEAFLQESRAEGVRQTKLLEEIVAELKLLRAASEKQKDRGQ